MVNLCFFLLGKVLLGPQQVVQCEFRVVSAQAIILMVELAGQSK
jgi:hypothetical protein